MPRSSARRRRFESLETRRALAGNVTAALVGNDLVIDGDAAANAISLVETANDGEFTITGLNDGSGTVTNVNGAPNGSATIAGVTGNIIVNLLAGDDAATLTNINHTGNLTIDAGAGNDTVSVGNVAIGANVSIQTGDDRNVVALSSLNLTGHLIVDTGTSANRQVPNTYSLVDSSIGGDARLHLGDRAGSIAVTNTTVRGTLELDNATQQVVFFPRLQDTYAAFRLDGVIASNRLGIDSVASALVDINNTFVGSGLDVRGYTSYNAFQIRNSRALEQIFVSSLAPGDRFGGLESAYDSVDLSGIVADGGFHTITTGDVRVAYSYSGAGAAIGTQGFDNVIVDTNIFNAGLQIQLGSNDDTLLVQNSIFRGGLAVKHSRFYENGSVDPQQRGNVDASSAMSFVSNRIDIIDIAGGINTDVVRITYNVIDQLFADLDLESSFDVNPSGSDLLVITGSIVNNQARLDGGPGFDLFVNSGSTLNGLVLAAFEAF